MSVTPPVKYPVSKIRHKKHEGANVIQMKYINESSPCRHIPIRDQEERWEPA